MTTTRRNFLGQTGILVGLACAVRGGGAVAADAACVDPATLPLSQRNRRRAIGYVEASTDPKKRCGICAFFKASSSGCGTCQLLSGGTVNSNGVCTSFAPKAA
jgi:High potential iron-sulfur protein